MKNLFGIHFVFCFLIIRTETSDNIALKKPTKQSSVFTKVTNIWTSDKAVDGNDRNDATVSDHNTCMVTDSSDTITTVWWYVDLVERSRILQVEIVYRDLFQNRLAGFSLYVSEKPNFSDDSAVLCYKHTNTSLPSLYQTLSCNATGKYVIVYNERLPNITYPTKYSTDAVLELCEVNVTGCPIGKFGKGDCNSNCSVGCINGDCYPNNGTCVQGCLHGWMSPKCDTCLPGVYGNLCEKSCSIGCNSTSCQRIDGECPCKRNWTGNVCDRCKQGLYGESCEYNCSIGCLKTECNKADGTCSQCNVGWSGQKCKVCADTFYGEFCEQNCSTGCKDRCKKTDGTCQCKKGWTGDKCEVCPHGFFGKTCEEKCSGGCKQMICNKIDGTCDCREGWTGNSCSVCKDGFYGSSCQLCSVGCRNKTCDKTNGSCNDMCKENWTGQKCDACTDGLYVNSCEQDCSLGCNRTQCDQEGGPCFCKYGWTGESCEELKERQNQPITDVPNYVPTIVGTLFAVIALLVIAMGSFIFIRRRRKKRTKNNTDHVYPGKQPENQPFSSGCLTESEDENNKPIGNVYENTNLILKHVIHIDKIREQVHRKKEQGTLDEEFDELPNGAIHSHTVSVKDENIIRNRYKTTFPYDHSRVILKDVEMNYINANYINGITTQTKYIAAQGPKTTTTEDFWQMIWQEQSCMIVMLTNIVEGVKRKCEQYWPDNLQSLVIDTLEIKLKDEMTYSFYIKRTFQVVQNETKKQLLVTQLHFTTWPDHGVPDAIELMLFHRRFKSLSMDKHNLPIVHCSAGIGRTGTFIALDAMVESARETDEINIFEYVVAMRQDRMNMIQTKEQYIVLHDALVEALAFDDTTITKENFSRVWTENRNDKPINQSRIRQEFKSLHSQRPKYKPLKDCKAASLEKNKNKNRSLDILPLDRYRVFITPRTSKTSDYINAISLSSYRQRNDIIVTQEPLENTKEDFWHMVKDQRPSVIVSLDTELEKGSGQGETTFTVSNWHAGKLPNEKTELVKIIEKVKCANDVDDAGPIIVVCRDGATCCGLFCIIYNSIQQLQVDGDVDIYQTAKQLMRRRPEFCQTFEQYQFCYDVVMEYLNTTDVYSN